MAYFYKEPSRTFGEYLLIPGYSSAAVSYTHLDVYKRQVLGGLLWFVSRSNAAEEAASSAAAEGSILLSSFAAGDVTSIRYAYGLSLIHI